MNIAVLSDIHSNKYALTSTLKYLEEMQIDKYIFLGDFFGYYPWAKETYLMIEKILSKSICILGNHDQLLLEDNSPNPIPEYWNVILQNKSNLPKEALEWLKYLKPEKTVILENLNFKLYHGTPEDSLFGRFYPDNKNVYDWFPKENEVILLGHTHYPFIKKTENNGYIINPGSVGQPRDCNLNSSICIIKTDYFSVDFYRVPYRVNEAIEELEIINWYPRAINSLKKSFT